mgnify:CR=1 FL=1
MGIGITNTDSGPFSSSPVDCGLSAERTNCVIQSGTCTRWQLLVAIRSNMSTANDAVMVSDAAAFEASSSPPSKRPKVQQVVVKEVVVENDDDKDDETEEDEEKQKQQEQQAPDMMNLLSGFLDKNKDGNVADDALGMLGNLLK